MLSEIFFKNNNSIEIKVNKIKQSINDVGFNNTASLFSISESSNTGGKIAGFKKKICQKILKELYKIKTGDTTDVIQLGNSYLILKIEEIKTKK